jgi:hypothetical protein
MQGSPASLGLPTQSQPATFLPAMGVLALAVNPNTIRVGEPPFALVFAQVHPVCGPPGTETFEAFQFRRWRGIRRWDLDRLDILIREYDHWRLPSLGLVAAAGLSWTES